MVQIITSLWGRSALLDPEPNKKYYPNSPVW